MAWNYRLNVFVRSVKGLFRVDTERVSTALLIEILAFKTRKRIH